MLPGKGAEVLRVTQFRVGGMTLIVSMTVGLVLLAAADVLLITQNRQLRVELVHAHHALLPPTGRHVPPLLGVSPTGEAVEVTYGEDQRETFVFVYSDSCAICSLAADPSGVRTVGLNRQAAWA